MYGPAGDGYFGLVWAQHCMRPSCWLPHLSHIHLAVNSCVVYEGIFIYGHYGALYAANKVTPSQHNENGCCSIVMEYCPGHQQTAVPIQKAGEKHRTHVPCVVERTVAIML
jgi:hypothetical protein